MTATATAPERPEAVSLKGKTMTLLGPELKAGDAAPAFTLKATDMSDKTLADYAGKVKVLVTIPSIDTPVCDVETRRFNQEAGTLGDDVVVLIVSIDLPMAQSRWCGAAGVDCVDCLSDYMTGDFGRDYGVKIKEIGLLCRDIFVIDKDDQITYHEHVEDLANEPNYDAALEAVKAAK
ncbi:MAG: thiol peroxidase [Planctomycetota bacterium]